MRTHNFTDSITTVLFNFLLAMRRLAELVDQILRGSLRSFLMMGGGCGCAMVSDLSEAFVRGDARY